MGNTLTIAEVADRLRLHPATIRRYVRNGQLDAARLPGGGLRFDPADIDALLTPTRLGDQP